MKSMIWGTLAIACLSSIPVDAMASDWNWPRGSDNCIMSDKQKKSRKQSLKAWENCHLFGLYTVPTPDGTKQVPVRFHGRLIQDEKDMAKHVAKTGLSFNPSSHPNHNGDLAARGVTRGIYHRGNHQKHPKEKFLFDPLYKSIYPVSSEKAMVKLFDDSWHIATAGSSKLEPVPFDWLALHRTNETTKQNPDAYYPIHVFVSVKGHGNGVNDIRKVMPDLTLGAVIERADTKAPRFMDIRDGVISVKVKDAATGAQDYARFNMSELAVPNAKVEAVERVAGLTSFTFREMDCSYGKCDLDDYRRRGDFAEVGQAPSGIGLPSSGVQSKLYWPVHESGKMIDRIPGVRGVIPYAFDAQYGYASLIAVLDGADGSGFDYMLVGAPGYKSDPHFASRMLERIAGTKIAATRFDDVRVFSGREGIALRKMGGSGDWVGLTPDSYKYGLDFGSTNIDRYITVDRSKFITNLVGAATPDAAMDKADQVKSRRKAFEQAIKDENQRSADYLVAEVGANQVTTLEKRPCQTVYYSTGNYARSNEAARRWRSLFDRDRLLACRNVPLDTINASIEANRVEYVETPPEFDMDAAMREFSRQMKEAAKPWTCYPNADGWSETCYK